MSDRLRVIINILKPVFMRLGVFLFAVAFFAIQFPATYKSVRAYAETRKWHQCTSKVVAVEYAGQDYDSEEGYYDRWRLLVSYEYEGDQYEAWYPYLEDTDLDEDGEQEFVGTRLSILVNPFTPEQIECPRQLSDIIISVSLCVVFALGAIAALIWVIMTVKRISLDR